MKYTENVVARAGIIEEKNGIKYAKVGSRLYNTVKVFYIIAFAFATALSIIFLLGMFMFAETMHTFSDNLLSVIGVILLTALMSVSLYISRYNAKSVFAWIFGGANLVSAVGLIVIFANLLREETGFGGLNVNFYWRHFAPLCLVVICAAVMVYISVRATVKFNNTCKKIVNNVYEQYRSLPDDNKPQWDGYLANYEF